MHLGANCLILTAHPDDETLWAGGLVAMRPLVKFTCICCSTPRRATEMQRAYEFFKACEVLGVQARQLPQVETNPGQALPVPLSVDELNSFDSVVTHNKTGEYGHSHHISVHDFTIKNATIPVYTFGYGSGDIVVKLEANAYAHKMAAMHQYITHSGPRDKWFALQERYPICIDQQETFYKVK